MKGFRGGEIPYKEASRVSVLEDTIDQIEIQIMSTRWYEFKYRYDLRKNVEELQQEIDDIMLKY